MASNRIVMEGLTEFREALRRLPEELATEAGDIVQAHAEAAKADIQRGYPIGPGSRKFPAGILQGRVVVERNRSKVSSHAIVRSRAPHAIIFERGTVTRRTDKGWNRGRMPKASSDRAMIPKVIRWRRKMTDALIEIVRRAGFEVQS
jgi:hypothetical protein